MQPSRLTFIPQAILHSAGQFESADRGSTLLLRVRQTRIAQTSQIRETRNRATNLQREDRCMPDQFRIYFQMKCVGKTCCATRLRNQEFRSLPEVALNSFPAHMLELAKGFEPPTLGLQNRCSTD